MMSVQDALEAWLAGDLSVDEACRLTGATDEEGLRELLPACGIDVECGKMPVNPFVPKFRPDILIVEASEASTDRKE